MASKRNIVLTVMKKECKRIFSDRKLFFTTVLLPGLMMFTMYMFIGTAMAAFFDIEDYYVYQIHAVNLPDSVAVLFDDDTTLEILHTYEDEIEAVKEMLTAQQTDLLVIFPQNFDDTVADFDPAGDIPAPNIQVWANFARTESAEASGIVRGMLNDFHHSLTHRFTINAPTDASPDGDFNLATDADMFAMLLGMVVPMLFIIFIYTGCQAIAPDSIAGEKERGTLGAILVTPASRRQIALGKILGIAVFALMSAVVSILGAVLAMPNMLGMEMRSLFEFYSAADFALLLLVALSTTLIFVSLLSVLSAYAKSVKEAASYAAPVFMLVFVAAIGGMFMGDFADGMFFYLIPVVNSALSTTAIFNFNANALNILIAAAVNFAFALAFTAMLARIFNSEKIMYDK